MLHQNAPKCITKCCHLQEFLFTKPYIILNYLSTVSWMTDLKPSVHILSSSLINVHAVMNHLLPCK